MNLNTALIGNLMNPEMRLPINLIHNTPVPDATP